MTTSSSELFLELSAFDPNWQAKYRRVYDAAVAAGCVGLYYLWLRTPDGEKYRIALLSTPDYDRVMTCNRNLTDECAP